MLNILFDMGNDILFYFLRYCFKFILSVPKNINFQITSLHIDGTILILASNRKVTITINVASIIKASDVITQNEKHFPFVNTFPGYLESFSRKSCYQRDLLKFLICRGIRK